MFPTRNRCDARVHRMFKGMSKQNVCDNRCEGGWHRTLEGLPRLNLCDGRAHRMFDGIPKLNLRESQSASHFSNAEPLRRPRASHFPDAEPLRRPSAPYVEGMPKLNVCEGRVHRMALMSNLWEGRVQRTREGTPVPNLCQAGHIACSQRRISAGPRASHVRRDAKAEQFKDIACLRCRACRMLPTQTSAGHSASHVRRDANAERLPGRAHRMFPMPNLCECPACSKGRQDRISAGRFVTMSHVPDAEPLRSRVCRMFPMPNLCEPERVACSHCRT